MSVTKILVVEDHEPFRRFIRLELQQRAEFHVVGEVSDGLEAVQQAQGLQPDVILLDIGLPGINGIEAARQVRRLVPDARILFVSQESSSYLVEETFRLGGFGFVQKMRAKTDLLPAIDHVLDGKRFLSDGLESDGMNFRTTNRHEVVFCSDDAVLLEALTSFIADALKNGNPAIVWATGSHRQSLLQTVSARGVDIEAAIRRETYIASDVAEPVDAIRIVATINGLRDAALKAGKKDPCVAVCGERAGRLWAGGDTDKAIGIEQYFNELAKRHHIEVLCPYPIPRERHDGESLKLVCGEHNVVSSR
jgi:DNA-binding NarL/FixJ family response regulator